MALKDQWAQLCYELARQPKVCTAGSRKILRGVTWSVPSLDDSLQLQHLGYSPTSSIKLRQLDHYYLNEESVDRAVSDYEERIKQGGYGSVGISTHGNTKEGFTKQGFCIQAFTLTQLPGRKTEVDVFYRTTEIVKKFGADLVWLRDRVLPHFDLTNSPVTAVNFHFANVSVHPMFFGILTISDPDWIDHMEVLEEVDPQFFKAAVKWTYRNINGREDAAFKQARRVGAAIHRELEPRQFRKIKRYLREKVT